MDTPNLITTHSPATPDAPTGADDTANATVLPFVDDLVKRATQGAHDMVDNVVGKVTSTVDSLQGGVSSVADSRDEWIEAARGAIRRHPFASVAGALLVGAALLSVTRSNDR